MGEIRDNIRRNLAYYLALKDISQKDFAERLGVSQSSVTCWIKGKNSPDIEIVAQICNLLEISVADLFGMDSRPPFRASEKEQRMIMAYRNNTDMRSAIDRLLGLDQHAADEKHDVAPEDEQNEESDHERTTRIVSAALNQHFGLSNDQEDEKNHG